MADLQNVKSGEAVTEKETPAVHPTAEPTTYPSISGSHQHAGASWYYRRRKIGPLTLPYYASPSVQLTIVAFVCFLCPGMFNALNGLGGGGQVDPSTSNKANIAVYSTFSVVGFFAGTFVNKLGVKATLSFGGIGYAVYAGSFLSFTHNQNEGFVIFAGTLLGICAGLLWAAQGAIMTSYPSEANKGKYIAWFWMIFNLGAVIGALIPLGQNINNNTGTTTDGTYVAFLVLMLVGAVLALTLANQDAVVRKDGSKVILMKHPTWKTEIFGLWEVFVTDPWIVLLFPMFFSSNWFYTYQFNSVNAAYFNIRTRSLNNVLYWLSQIWGSFVFGYALDYSKVSRSMRAKAGLVTLFVLTMAIWGGGYAFQTGYTRDLIGPLKLADPGYGKDWADSGYVGPMFLFIFYGAYDAAWQTSVYWFLGSLTNNSRKLANFVGFYKGIQSAGGAIMPAIDNQGVPYMNELASCWALLAGSLLVAAPVIFLKVKDHTSIEEDLKFSDETIEDVKPLVTTGTEMGHPEKV